MADCDEDIFVPGERFRGYVVERLLGKGGLGAVYLVRHEMLDALFALKVLFPQIARTNPNYIKRFLREARISTRVRHRNLVAVHDCGFDNEKDVYYLVMDYVNGSNLREALAFSGVIDCREAVKIVAQVASALDAAQRFSMVHRDIKPENIMIQSDGTVKLVDLGIAKAVGLKDSLQTTMNGVFGTPAYVSPEQVMAASEVDVRADIYSLGVVFFEMLCGRCPYVGKNAPIVLSQVLSNDPIPDVREFYESVPADLAVLIGQMCEKDRTRRLKTPKEVIAKLVGLGYIDDYASEKTETVMAAEESVESLMKEFASDESLQDAKNTLSFDTKDVEIQQFITKLKRRKMVTRFLIIAIPLLAFFLIYLILIW